MRKHTYSVTGRDFSFTRLCDDHVVGHKIEGSLEVTFVSPLGDNYEMYMADARCILDTSANGPRDHPFAGRLDAWAVSCGRTCRPSPM